MSTSRSPGGPPLNPGPPRPLRRIVWPSLTPAGMRACTWRARRSTPEPWHVGHGSSMMLPVPAQRWHGVENENRPWLSSTTPRPPHTGQTFGAVPGRAPEPLTRRALRVGGEVQRGGEAEHGVGERQRQRGADVLAAARPDARTPRPARAGRPTEHLPEQVAEAGAVAGEVVDVEAEATASTAGRPAAHRPEPAHLVVLVALGLVAEHVVGDRHLLEALLGGGVVRGSCRGAARAPACGTPW